MGQNGERLLLRSKPPGLLQFGSHSLIDKLAAAVVGRNNDGPFRIGRIVLGDGLDALVGVRNLGNSSLLAKHFNTPWQSPP